MSAQVESHYVAESAQAVEVDDEYGDDSKAYGYAASTLNSKTTSLASGAFDYQYENGRRYHNYRAGKYTMPNDDQEQDRLDLAHHLWLKVMKGEPHLAPLKNPKSILDLGTGTGIWAVELGDMYPDAEVLGTDLSPIQPQWVPPNVRFEIDDCEDTWAYGDQKFSYIHTRDLSGAVKDWPKLISKIYDFLEPNGYAEFQELNMMHMTTDDDSLPENSGWDVYYSNFKKAFKTINIRLDAAASISTWMKSAGYVDIVDTKYKIPIGPWPKQKRLKEIGAWNLEVAKTGLEAYALAMFTRVLEMDKEKAKTVIANAVEDLKNPKIHMYIVAHVVYGRKPGNKK